MLNNNVIQTKDYVTYTCDTGYTLFNNKTKHDSYAINSDPCTADNSNVNLNIPTGFQCRPDCPLSTIPDGNIKNKFNGTLTPYTTVPSNVIYGTELQQKCDDTHYLHDQTSNAPHTAESYTMKCGAEGTAMQPGNYECKKYCPVSLGNVNTTSDHGFTYPLTGGAIGTNWTDSSKTSYNLKHGETAEFKCNTATHTLWDTKDSLTQNHIQKTKIWKTCASGDPITPLTGALEASCKKQCKAKGMFGAKMVWGVDTISEYDNKPYIDVKKWVYDNGPNPNQNWDPSTNIPNNMTNGIKYKDYVRYSCIDGYTLHTKQTGGGLTKHNNNYYDMTCDSGNIDPTSVIQCTKDCSYKSTATIPNTNINWTPTVTNKMITNDIVTFSCTNKETHQLFGNNVIVTSADNVLQPPTINGTCNADGSYSFTGTGGGVTTDGAVDIDGANIQCKKIYKLDDYQVIPNGGNALGSWSSP